MSYDISLNDPITNRPIVLATPHQMKGGTYQVGGCSTAELNVTYNYSKHFCRVIDKEHGIRFLYDKSGAETIPILKKAIEQLGDDESMDYWESTEGNAKKALQHLLTLATLHPEGIWKGD